MKLTILQTIVGFAAALLSSGAAFAQSSHYQLDWSTIDAGAGTGAGGTYKLSGTVGQPDAGPVARGGSYALAGGFWPGMSTVQSGRPRLEIALAGPIVYVSWPASATGFRLQETSNLASRNWSYVTTPPFVFGNENVVAVPVSPNTHRFYRLANPSNP